MKKITKTLVTLACVATLGAGVCAMSACGGGEKTGEAYGLVHGAGYVGYATVTVSNDKVKDATLTEVCFPTEVKKSADTYYSSVTYGEVTMTYDVDAKTYKVGTQTLKEYFKSEANCKAYYEAVVGNKVKADGAENIMTKAALCKDDNGYWSTNLGTKLGWKANRDATIKYVEENGIDNLLKLVKNDDTGIWMDGTVSTGATWNDLNSEKEGSISYAQLIVNAYNAAK